MARPALLDALTDFGRVARDPVPFALGDLAPAGDFDMPAFEPPAPDGPDVDAMIAEAVATAQAALAERLTSEHEAALTAEREAHAEAIAALERSAGEAAATLIGDRLAALETQIVSLTSSVAGRMIAPLMSARLQEAAVERLAAAITDALRDAGAIRVEVRGPTSMYEALAAALGERAAMLHHVEAPGFDLRASIDDSVYETRLSEWASAIEEVLG